MKENNFKDKAPRVGSAESLEWKTTTPEEWEKEFDAIFELDSYGKSTAVQDKVKQFIRSLLTQDRARVEEKLEAIRAKLHNGEDAYANVVDVLHALRGETNK